MDDVVEDISHQLHAGIMKSARKVFIDEIFSSVLPEMIACRKTEKQMAAKRKSQAAKVCFICHGFWDMNFFCITYPFANFNPVQDGFIFPD